VEKSIGDQVLGNFQLSKPKRSPLRDWSAEEPIGKEFSKISLAVNSRKRTGFGKEVKSEKKTAQGRGVLCMGAKGFTRRRCRRVRLTESNISRVLIRKVGRGVGSTERIKERCVQQKRKGHPLYRGSRQKRERHRGGERAGGEGSKKGKRVREERLQRE